MLLDSTRLLEKSDVENEKPGRLRLSLRREFGPVSNSTSRTLFFFLPVFAVENFYSYRKTLMHHDFRSATTAVMNRVACFVRGRAHHANCTLEQ